jgi:hypothetical protein
MAIMNEWPIIEQLRWAIDWHLSVKAHVDAGQKCPEDILTFTDEVSKQLALNLLKFGKPLQL